MKKNVEICRAEHEDKKKEPSFDGSFFVIRVSDKLHLGDDLDQLFANACLLYTSDAADD